MTSGSNEPAPKQTFLWTAAAVLPALLLAGWQATWPWPFFSDDSFISLRYSERLLQGHGLTWTETATDTATGAAEYVEGYSNLLWVLLTAGLGSLGIELVTAARALGAIATLVALWLLAAALRPRDLRTAIVAAAAPLLVATTQPVMIWTLAGLEGPLVMMLLAWGFGGLIRRCVQTETPALAPVSLVLAGVPFALACWTRPDGPLWALTAGTGIAVVTISNGVAPALRRAFWLGLPAMIAVVAQLAFRLYYYDDFVPNTAHVKAEFDPDQFGPGWQFVQNALFAMPGLTIAAALGTALMLLHRSTRAFTTVLLLPVLAWLSYLMVIGGDHFPGLRLLHGLLVPMALLAGLGLRTLRWPNVRLVLAATTAIAAGFGNAWTARHDPRSMEARSETWEWHGKALGTALRRAFVDPSRDGEAVPKPLPRIAVDAAGALPYYSKLPALDLLGLCDRTIATTPFPNWIETVRPGTPKPPGHMRGNGSYAIEQQPDLMAFQHAPGLPLPVFVSACEFEDDPRFFQQYRCVLLDLGTPEVLPGVRQPHVAPLWVRTEGRAGIRRSPEQVVVPAYLFGSFRARGAATNRYQPPSGDASRDAAVAANLAAIVQFWQQRTATAVPTAPGPFALAIATGARVDLPLRLTAGNWRFRIEPAEASVELLVDGGGKLDGAVVQVGGKGLLTLALTGSSAKSPPPRRIVFDRIR